MQVFPEHQKVHEIIRKKARSTRLGWIGWFIGCSLIIGWITDTLFGMYIAVAITGILIAITIVVGTEKERNGLPKALSGWMKFFIFILSIVLVVTWVFALVLHNTEGARYVVMLIIGVVLLVASVKSVDHYKKEKNDEITYSDTDYNRLMRVAVVEHIQERHSTSINNEGEISGGTTSTTESPIRNEEYEMKEDLAQIIMQKPNGNLFVSGTAGSGKSSIIKQANESFEHNPRLIFAFKPGDVYFNMGLLIMDITKHIPDVFAGNKEALINAFMVITKIEKQGLTASEIQPLIRNAVKRSHNWKTFEDELRRISKTANNIQRTAIEHILLVLPNLRIDSHPVELELGRKIVLDMTMLANDEVRGFYTEIILYQIFERIRTRIEVPIDEKLIVCIDEVHRILKNQNASIIEIMAREMRPYAMLWLTTQNYSDLSPSIKNQMYTQLVFSTTHSEDLTELSKINRNLPFAISTLGHGEFVDTRQPYIHKRIHIYKIRNLKSEDKPKIQYEGIPVAEKEGLGSFTPQPQIHSEEKYDYATHYNMAGGAQKKPNEPDITTGGSVAVQDRGESLRDKILEVLDKNEESLAISVVAKALYKNESEKPDKDKVKLAVNNELIKLVRDEVIDKQSLVNEKGKIEKHCFRKDENLSKFHVTLQNRSAKILRKNGITILGEASHQGIQGEDITLDNCVIEDETGLKESLGSFDKKVMEHAKPVIIVVPNNEQKERYSFLPSVKSGKAKVVLLPELIQAVKEMGK